MKLLEVKHLDAFYGDFQALFAMDLSLEEKETVAIIGANGAGKSTLLRSICGLLPRKAESIVFAGKPIGGLLAHDITKLGIAMVPEGRRLFPSLTVEENLLIGGYSRRPGSWNLDRIYQLFPVLKERRKHPGTALSGGQQQMVAIGRALMSNPMLLLCDEISLGLAPVVIKEIYQSMGEIRSGGTTVLIVEQDINQALAAADRVYCFQEGRISLEGRPNELSREEIKLAYFGV